MDRKSIVEHQGGEKSTNGEDRSKESALDKLHQMEWMRNKQDTWHLARSNSRGSDVQEKKKYNKDEDNYFEGTGSQKNKKFRKPRPTESPGQSSVPPGFSISSGSSGPPPVNAWSQKKGSALFNKEPEEGDEMLKMAIEQSLITVEEDNRRRLERLRMMNMEVQPSVKNKNIAEKELEDGVRVQRPEFVGVAAKPQLHFIDTDSVDEMPSKDQRRKPAPPRAMMKQSPPSQSSVNNNAPEPYRPNRKFSPPQSDADESDHEDIFEPSRPDNKFTKSITNDYEISDSSYPYRNLTSKPKLSRAIVIPEKDVPSVKNLASNLKSSLTFGDTQGLLEEIQDDYVYKPPAVSQSYEEALPAHRYREVDDSVQIPTSKSSSSSGPGAYLDSTETDIMLHNFIRHDPPAPSGAITFQKPETQTEVFPHNSPQPFNPCDSPGNQQHSFLNGIAGGNAQSLLTSSNGQDSSSSVTDSPLQNVSPYGSLEKQMSPGYAANLHMQTQSGQFPFPYPMSLQGNHESVNSLQAMQQLTSHNLPPQVAYSGIPPGYTASNHLVRVPIPQIPPQYRLPNSSVISPQIYQAQLQHMMAINALQQYQQSQMPAFNSAESVESLQKEQSNSTNHNHMIPVQPQRASPHNQPQIPDITNQPQIPVQNQPQMLATPSPQQISVQNRPQILPSQNYPQIIPTPEAQAAQQEGFPNEYQQQMSSQNLTDQRMLGGGKNKEEILLQYQQTLQTLNHLQQQLAETTVHSPPAQIPQPQPQPYNFYPAAPMAMGMNQFYPGMAIIPQNQPQLNQQIPSARQVSPDSQQAYPNISGLLNSSSDVIHGPVEPKNGRGRGRLH